MSVSDWVGTAVFLGPLALFAAALVIVGIGTGLYAIGKGVDAALVRVIELRRLWKTVGSESPPAGGAE